MRKPLFSSALSTLLAAGLLLGGLSACDLSNGSSSDDDGPQLKFQAQAAKMVNDSTAVADGDTLIIEGPSADADRSRPLKIEEGQGRIRVHQGFFITAYAQEDLEGEIDRDERTIELRLEAESLDDDATRYDLAGVYAYNARITDLEPGTYQFVVRHKGDVMPFRAGTTDEVDEWATVLEQEVQVQ